jgi:conjugal transfer pilus assembly protein TraB
MVMRDGALLTSALIAGTLSGLGNSVAATQGTNSISPLGTTTTYSAAEILKTGIGNGVGNGLDMLAKYKIKQAENLQPIIQINGGRIVDIVFYTSAQIGVTSGNPMPKSGHTNSNKELMDAISSINQIPGE